MAIAKSASGQPDIDQFFSPAHQAALRWRSTTLQKSLDSGIESPDQAKALMATTVGEKRKTYRRVAGRVDERW